ncbi:hypothetical protein [Hyphomonas sp.]|uniref:hypothetical protein n=1 Tax=Hyphomonas sp. TaxID=87 RepID=UPI0025C6DAD1|nr:hypothetical protein [Hyphomonas sp.]
MIEDGSLLDPPKTPEPDRVVKAESGERPSYAFGMPKKPPVVEAKSSGEPSPISFGMPKKPPTTEAAPSKEPSPISFGMPKKPPMTEAEPSRVPEKPPMTEDTGIHIDDYVSPRQSSGIAPNPREPLAAPTVSINDYGAGSRDMSSQQRQTVIQPRSVSPTSLAAGNRSERTFMSGGANTSSSFGLLSLMNQKLPNWRTMMG